MQNRDKQENKQENFFVSYQIFVILQEEII